MQEVLQRLGVGKTRTTPLHPQSDGMAERYVKTIEEHLRKVVSTHQRNWDERLPIFLLAYRASTHDTTGMTPANMVFGLWFNMRQSNMKKALKACRAWVKGFDRCIETYSISKLIPKRHFGAKVIKGSSGSRLNGQLLKLSSEA
jgi:hypothetical protein